MSARIIAFNKCENCGIEYGRKRFPAGKLELMSQFKKRRFCSHKCSVIKTGSERAIPFSDRVDRFGGGDACWPWTGAINSGGYGSCWVNGAVVTASRHAYEIENGNIPEGKGYHGTVVMHSCDNRKCVNPTHLKLGTQGDNNIDRDTKGRGWWQAPKPTEAVSRTGEKP